MTETPPWGSPDAQSFPATTDHPGREIHGRIGPPPSSTIGGFFLVVEQLSGHAWCVEPPPIWGGGDRDVAREAALELARSYRPEHPLRPQGRLVLRTDPDNLLVIVQGASGPYHFRVTVAERLF